MQSLQTDSITTIQQAKEYTNSIFSERETFSPFFPLDLSTHSVGDEEDVSWHKSALNSCFITCANGGSDVRGFKVGNHSHTDRCSP